MTVTPRDITGFWHDDGYQGWFSRDAAFDRRCRDFAVAHDAAARRELDHWMESPEGSLALVLLLDQIPRNVFRGSAHAYATDSLARHFADRAIGLGHDLEVHPDLRVFFYLPFEHSESLADQERCVALSAPLKPEYLDYAVRHRDVIRRFGRFPHRNQVLGRASTPEEVAYLEAGGGF